MRATISGVNLSRISTAYIFLVMQTVRAPAGPKFPVLGLLYVPVLAEFTN